MTMLELSPLPCYPSENEEEAEDEIPEYKYLPIAPLDNEDQRAEPPTDCRSQHDVEVDNTDRLDEEASDPPSHGRSRRRRERKDSGKSGQPFLVPVDVDLIKTELEDAQEGEAEDPWIELERGDGEDVKPFSHRTQECEDDEWSPSKYRRGRKTKVSKPKSQGRRSKVKSKKSRRQTTKPETKTREKTKKTRQLKSKRKQCEDSTESDQFLEQFKSVLKADASKMTPEELIVARAKWREETRQRRAAELGEIKLQAEPNVTIKKEEHPNEIEEPPQKKARRGRSKKAESQRSESKSKPKKRGSSGGRGRRKKVSEMTEEEREEMKAKWREEARRRRQQKRETMTPMEREEYLARERELKRQSRARAKETLPPEQLEAIRKRESERRRARKQHITAEKRRELSQKAAMRRILKRAEMTDDERSERKMAMYMKKVARLSEMSQEEIEAEKQEQKAKARSRWATMSEDRKRAIISRTVENQRKWRLKRRLEKGLGPTIRKRRQGETDEEWRAHKRKIKAQYQRKMQLRRKIEIQKLLDSGVHPDLLVDPEKRQKDLVRNRIRNAKTRLRTKLMANGAAPHEIQAQLAEVEKTYTPTFEFRPYKPYTEKRINVTVEEFEKLKDELDPGTYPLTRFAEVVVEPPGTKSKKRAKSTSKLKASSKRRIREVHVYNSKACQDEKPVAPLPHPEQPPEISQCSFVSVTSTPEPTTFLQVTTEPASATTVVITPQLQNQPHFSQDLQHILDAINYQESASVNFYFHAPPGFPQQNHAQTLGNQAQLQPAFIVPVPDDCGASSYNGEDNSLEHVGSSNWSTSVTATVLEEPKPTSAEKKVESDAHVESRGPSLFSSIPPPENDGQDNNGGSTKRRKWTEGKYGPRGSQKRNSSNQDLIACEICGNLYKESYLAAHRIRIHCPHYQNGVCLLCNEVYRDSKQFLKHYRKNHMEPPDKNISSRNFTRKELEGVRRKLTFVSCDTCGKEMLRSSLREHMRSIHNDERYRSERESKHMGDAENCHICETCGRAFSSEQCVKRHNDRVHLGIQLINRKCRYCGEDKEWKDSAWRRHLYGHLEFRKKLVPRCGRAGCEELESFENEADLNEHYKVAHNAHFPCSFCKFISHTQACLLFHYTRCNKIRKDKRDEIRSSDDFKDVFQIDKIRVACSICSMTVLLSSLTRHNREIHGVKEDSVVCHKCDKDFRQRGYLVAHLMDHHGMEWNDEMTKEVTKLSFYDKSEVEVRNEKGLHKNTLRKLAGLGGYPGQVARRKAREERKQKEKMRRRSRKMRRKREEEDEDDVSSDGEDEQADEEAEVALSAEIEKGRRSRRLTRPRRCTSKKRKPTARRSDTVKDWSKVTEILEREKRMVIEVAKLTEEELNFHQKKKEVKVEPDPEPQPQQLEPEPEPVLN